VLTIQLRLRVPEPDMLDASDDLQRLLDREGEVCPPLRDLLLSLDDAMTEAFDRAAPTRARAVA
jgi:hypothetical protein